MRQYRSGRGAASYLGPDGECIGAEETFETGLARPAAGAVNFLPDGFRVTALTTPTRSGRE